MKLTLHRIQFSTSVLLSILILASCSYQRYGYLQRGEVKKSELTYAKSGQTKPTMQSTISDIKLASTNIKSPSAILLERNFINQSNVENAFYNSLVVKPINAKEIKNKFVNAAIKNTTKIQFAKKDHERTSEFKKGAGVNKKNDLSTGILILIAFFIPPVAVGLASDWEDTNALIVNILLTLLCGIPGIIHAIIYILDNE